MTLSLNGIAPKDQDWLTEQLPDEEPTDQQVHDIAERLVQRLAKEPNLVAQAELIVRRRVNLNREQETTRTAIEANRHFIFARLDKTATKTHPVYQPWKIFERDFSAFCQEHGLSETWMLRVAAGELDSYRGWKQGMTPGSLGTRRTKVIQSKNPHPAGIAGPFFTVWQGKGSWDGPAAPVFQPTKIYTPIA